MTEAVNSEKMIKEKKVATLKEAQQYVTANTVRAEKGSMCVDGRYVVAVDYGRVARPGGDGGDVETLLYLRDQGKLDLPEEELTPEALTDRVIKVVNNMGEDFTIHTDNHSHSTPELNSAEDASLGCAHLAKAADSVTSQPYKVNPEDMQRVIKHIKRRKEEGAKVRITKLNGLHLEQGILVVIGKEMTVNHSNVDTQFFVYDQARDYDYIKNDLLPRLDIPGLTIEDYLEASKLQREATLGYVAKGLSIFTVNADGPVAEVSEAGKV